MIIFKKINKYLYTLLIILGIICITIENYFNQQLSIDRRKEEAKVSVLKGNNRKGNDDLFDGMAIAQLIIAKINFNKVIIKSDPAKLQKNIDLNNVVTTNQLKDSPLVLYGHYTDIKNLVFNRLTELKKGDILEVVAQGMNQKYQLNHKAEIMKDDLGTLVDKARKSLLIITCTTDFNDEKYYYLKANLIG